MRLKASVSRAGVRVPVNRSFERELAVLESMSGTELDEAAVTRVRKALGHENNYLVAKAAKLVSDNILSALLPEVLTAYDRFFTDPVKSDPQCWAKNALVKSPCEAGVPRSRRLSSRSASYPGGARLGWSIRHRGRAARHLHPRLGRLRRPL